MTFEEIHAWRRDIKEQSKVYETIIDFCKQHLAKLETEMDSTFKAHDEELDRVFPNSQVRLTTRAVLQTEAISSPTGTAPELEALDTAGA